MDNVCQVTDIVSRAKKEDLTVTLQHNQLPILEFRRVDSVDELNMSKPNLFKLTIVMDKNLIIFFHHMSFFNRPRRNWNPHLPPGWQTLAPFGPIFTQQL